MDERERIMNKWAPIMEGMGLTGSKADWMSQYAQMHEDNETAMPDSDTEQTKFPSVFPIATRIVAQTVGLDLVSVVPLGSNTTEELDRIKAEVEAENRDRKIDSVIEGQEYEEMKVNEHPDFVPGPRGDLFYLDYNYTDPNTTKLTDVDIDKVDNTVKTNNIK